MRKFLLLFMLATTAATPALAQDSGERRLLSERLREAAEQRRSQSANQAVRAERQEQRQDRAERQQQRQERAQRGDRADRQERRQERMERREQRAIAGVDQHRGFDDRLRDAVAIERARQNGDLRDGRRDRDGNWRDGERRRDREWRGDWRRDSRYDWRRHRERNRSTFRFGIYYDPFGYSYRPYNIGWPMRSSYWSDNYWIRDPWMYRLPPAYGPYRWIRYWDDAVLVDVRSGRVVDVIHNFFW